MLELNIDFSRWVKYLSRDITIKTGKRKRLTFLPGDKWACTSSVGVDQEASAAHTESKNPKLVSTTEKSTKNKPKD